MVMEDAGSPGSLQVVVFSVEGKVLGVDILRVQEILRMVEITPVPKMPSFALGAVNVRGRLVPIINLRLKLGLPERDPVARTCIMLVRAGEQVVGFLVDEVAEVLDIPSSHLEGPEEAPPWMRHELFSGVGKLPGRMLVLLNPDKLLTPQEEVLLPGAAKEEGAA